MEPLRSIDCGDLARVPRLETEVEEAFMRKDRTVRWTGAIALAIVLLQVSRLGAASPSSKETVSSSDGRKNS